MNIIKEKWLFLNSTLVYVPPQIKKLYAFGLAAFATRSVVSLSANARLLPYVWATSKSKSWRLTKNSRFIPLFQELMPQFVSVSPNDIVIIDFSDFGNGFQVLMFSKETKHGRALPLYFEILRYPIPKDSQNTFIMNAIRRFEEVVGCKPKLVFDRGFAAPSLVRFLLRNSYVFYLRVRKKKTVFYRGKPMLMPDVFPHDARVGVYESSLRLVRSDLAPGAKEPWYLVTNDFVSSRNEVIDIYYHRFEIEEFFRDAKRLLGLERVYFKTERSLAVILWFVILGNWCLLHLEGLLDALHECERVKMGLSRIRYIFEKLASFSILAVEREFMLLGS